MKCCFLRLFFIFLILLIFPARSFCQQSHISIPNTPFLQRLAIGKPTGVAIGQHENKPITIFPIHDDNFKNYAHILLLNNKRLYVFLSASGIVYESDSLDPQKPTIQFNRIDSTQHFGYNINCYAFFYNNNLYNIGGYGFWRWNGQLRTFMRQTKGWDIVPLNKEVPLYNELIMPNVWYNHRQGKILSLYHIEGNQAVKNNDPEKDIVQVDSVMELDLQTNSWHSMGVLTANLVENKNRSYLLANLDNGLLVKRNDRIEYWDLISNSIKVLNNAKIAHILFTQLYGTLIWVEKNKLFYGNPQKTTHIDSIVFKDSDFVMTNHLVYTPINQKLSLQYWLIFISALILLAAGFFFYQQYKTKRLSINHISSVVANDIAALPAQHTNITSLPQSLQSAYPNQQLFNSIEIALIKLISDNINNHNRYTNIDEINRALGMLNKSANLQKRKRSDIISAINNKWSISNHDRNSLLIDRIKSGTDGRSNEYFISQENLKSIEQLLTF